jgi:hypothetical protein
MTITNIDGVSVKEWLNSWLQVSDRVQYRHDTKTGVNYTAFKDIPMGDWDWPNEGHATEQCLTITCLQDVLDTLNEYLSYYEDHVRVYVTPGGVRAFFLGQPRVPQEFWFRFPFYADPIYRKFTLKSGIYSARVSPKPNRAGDFVARYVCTLANAEADPKLLEQLLVHHDQRIDYILG